MRKQPRKNRLIVCGFLRKIILASSLLSTLVSFNAMAVLAIEPTRIVFEGRTRSEAVTIFNQNNYAATYRISFKNMRMLENGTYIDIKKEKEKEAQNQEQHFADSLIRFSPRQVTIPAGKMQSVRLLVRKPRNLADGEYRSYLVIEEIPDANVGTNVEKINIKKEKVNISLIAHYVISIPIIVRQGTLNAKSKLEKLTYQPKTSSLSVKIKRYGNQSLYGNLSVDYQPKDGQKIQIGTLNHVAVYTPNASRTLSIVLNIPASTHIGSGALNVIYRTTPESGSKLLAEATVSLP